MEARRVCQTEPFRPSPSDVEARNVTATSAYVHDEIFPRDFETRWRIQYATAEAGPWATAPGGEGTIDQAEAEAIPKGGPYPSVGSRLTGLQPTTSYYVRVLAESEPEFEGHKELEQATSGISSFTTSGGPPIPTAFAVHSLHGESLRLLGNVNPNGNGTSTSAEQTITIEGAPTGGTFTLSFEGKQTGPIPYNASRGELINALIGIGLHTLGGVESSRLHGGPFTVSFTGGVSEPQITADASGLTPSGTISVTTTQQGGEGSVTHYRFEYIAEEKFTADGESFGVGTEDTPEVEGTGVTGADLPSLEAGETYRYRLFATSTAPGNPVKHSAEQTVTAPKPAPAGPESPCPNQALRTGLSADLPDCRAYEQVTPVEKGGTQDISTYGLVTQEFAVGEDGEHLMLTAPGTNWGTSPDSKASSYFFSRTPAGWAMTSATPQTRSGRQQLPPAGPQP